MATTTDYINQLKVDKQTLVDNLVAKGVTATNDETFTSLVPKVSEISGGSSKYAPRYIMFYKYEGKELNEEVANLDTSNVTNMGNMFSNCSKLTSLDLSNFNTNNVINMQYMFNGCSYLETLYLSNFNTSNVKNMQYMFNNCTRLTSLDVSNFNTSNVTNMVYMFYYCSKLKDLNLGDFDASKIIGVDRALAMCESLENITGCFKNLGQAYLTTASANFANYRLLLSSSPLLTEQSIINMLNGLYDIKTKGCKTQSVLLGSDNLAKLTSDAGQQALEQAMAYGWTVS